MNRQELELMGCPFHQEFIANCIRCKEVEELWNEWALRHRIEVHDDIYIGSEAERHLNRQEKVRKEPEEEEHREHFHHE